MNMKNIIKYLSIFCLGALLIVLPGCEDLLEKTPESTTSPANYLIDESHLMAYITNYYTSDSYSQESGRLDVHNSNPSGSSYWRDTKTDNAIGTNGQTIFLPGEVKVSLDGGSWNFGNIRALNYYLEIVVPRMHARSFTGNEQNCKHYVGEGYFLRAHEYFYRLRSLGDFPIITKVLPDVQEECVIASRRYPRNEVARFILADLDSAINLLQVAPPDGKVRISKRAALLLKARVALFEASWEKYHEGTALVPNGPGWPGKTKDYTINTTVRGEQKINEYQFPTGNGLQGEIDFFLDQAMDASKQVADAVPLTYNNKTIRSSMDQAVNPYYDMFCCTDPSVYPEAIMYRIYGGTIKHGYGMTLFGYRMGYTHQMEVSFLMENGLPIYAPGSGYAGDDYIQDTKVNRDWRWKLFMRAPGDPRALFDSSNPVFAKDTCPNPAEIHKSDNTKSTSTGYLLGKGITYDYHFTSGTDYTAFVVFRAAEAYLIYLEASYMKTGTIDTDADRYWRALRTRAGVDPDYNKTIAATDMSIEAQTDWGAYSHGQLVDATLYNIRRERRCEFIGEGHRWTDLLRWRALDQLNGFQLEGCKVWGPMKSQYKAKDLLYSQANDDKNVMSNPSLSPYIRMLQIKTSETNKFRNGYFWTEAHYLSPIPVKQFLLTSTDGQSIETSPIYQNPKWPTEVGMGAEQ